MPVSSTIGPSGSGGEGQLMPGGAVGARPGPRPAGAAAGAGCCASSAIPANTSVNANTRIRIANLSLECRQPLYARFDRDKRRSAANQDVPLESSFRLAIGPVKPREKGLDVGRLPRRAAPNPQAYRGITISSDIIGGAFFLQHRHDGL